MKFLNRKTGHLAENLAAKELTRKGYRILERNFGNKWGEIDIIAKDQEAKTLVFVEVKCKVGEKFGAPEEMISPGKLRRVRNMANIYMNQSSVPACRQAGRIDVVAVVLKPNNSLERLTHYENVY